jgi:transposase
MLQLTAGQRILLALEPADFRKGIDSLAAICKAKLDEDPFSGTVFAFTNRKRTSVKVLVFDGNGFWLIMKRFSKGKLSWWPADKGETLKVRAEALQILLIQGDPRFMHAPTPWRYVNQDHVHQAVVQVTA